MNIEPTRVNGSPAFKLTGAHGAEATILLHGGHVISWKPDGVTERLYVSPKADFSPGSAIRGGAPVCFPQFSTNGPLPQHGFVRTMEWRQSPGTEINVGKVTLELDHNEETHRLWAHAFKVFIRMYLFDNRLKIVLFALNSGTEEFSFTAALHTYLKVDDIGKAAVTGLKNLPYYDKPLNARATETADKLVFDREIDRIYATGSQSNHVVLSDGSGALKISGEAMPDFVIWNPWVERSRAMADLPDDAYRHFVCVESAVINDPVILQPGETWKGVQNLEVV
ncbi:MAG: D-hexose-6-phosphate mutarotase [Methylobacteriaceae bacterium]|jgi:glucose-6-phosphate 1-epimerase|nr:D-hexose-6-phosphate mutarotase [Methylobacteriaceae bacterium]